MIPPNSCDAWLGSAKTTEIRAEQFEQRVYKNSQYRLDRKPHQIASRSGALIKDTVWSIWNNTPGVTMYNLESHFRYFKPFKDTHSAFQILPTTKTRPSRPIGLPPLTPPWICGCDTMLCDSSCTEGPRSTSGFKTFGTLSAFDLLAKLSQCVKFGNLTTNIIWTLFQLTASLVGTVSLFYATHAMQDHALSA